MTFIDKFRRVTAPQGLGLCVGLDPDPNRLPAQFSCDLKGISDFLDGVITASAPFAAAYKVNTAFFEAWGTPGWALLERIAGRLPEASLRIADAKRGDIGNTAQHYAKAFLENLPFDAITLSPYLGGDTLQPYLKNPDKGGFVLALTSNPGAKDLQYYTDGTDRLYQRVLAQIPAWAPQHNLGAVVGATHPEELIEIRHRFPNVPLLIPGIGAQGGDAAVVANLADPAKAPLLVNLSRAILYPESKLAFPESVVEACGEWKKKLLVAGG
ncbi:MAG: orotidine-5'-phosphate decarboxylase [bacterium]|nr:orotidine-5'-phosphate decarboxylase [bacterium]